MTINNEEKYFSDEDPKKHDETGYHNDKTAESESESDEEHIKLTEPSKNAIYNKEGLNDKLQDISLPENIGWIHRLSIVIDQDQKVDVNDDLNRELSFYTQALEGARRAYGELESRGLPFLRPSDYYAEMVKSDTHMEKVKSRLLAERKNIEEAEERKKAREAKRIAKAVQAQKLKERSAHKKTEIEAVKKFRKQRQQSGFNDKFSEMDFPFEEGKGFERSGKKRPVAAPGDRTGGKGRQPQKGGKKRLVKRKMKNSKFGGGGRKGLKRQNTADSTNDLRGFNKGDARGNKRAKLK